MRVCAFIILATSFAALPARAVPLPRYGIFLYSNECREQESDDAAGNFVKLTRTPKGDKVEYGWPEGPTEVVDTTDVQISSGKISFNVPPGTIYNHKDAHFEGTISATELRLSGEGVPDLLRRQPLNYKPKVCAPLP